MPHWKWTRCIEENNTDEDEEDDDNQHNGNIWGLKMGSDPKYASIHPPLLQPIPIIIFFSAAAIEPDTRLFHLITDLAPRQNPLRLFPSLTVLPLRRLDRFLLGRQHPTKNEDVLETEIVVVFGCPSASILMAVAWETCDCEVYIVGEGWWYDCHDHNDSNGMLWLQRKEE